MTGSSGRLAEMPLLTAGVSSRRLMPMTMASQPDRRRQPMVAIQAGRVVRLETLSMNRHSMRFWNMGRVFLMRRKHEQTTPSRAVRPAHPSSGSPQ